MRAPILQGYGGTKPSKQGLSYLSDAGATPEAFGAGIGKALGGLGESIVEAGLAYEKRNEKTDRFTALIGLSEFQMRTAEQLTELKRTVPANVTDFPKQANTLYTQNEQAFIAGLKPQHQREFAMRAQQIKQGVMGDAFNFQYTQQDAFFQEGINTELERAKNGVFQTPDEYAKWDAHMAEVIASSDLPTAEKARLAREVQGALTAVLYGRKKENEIREGTTVGGDIVDRIIQVESGGNPNASPSTSQALGLGQFIPSTWKAFIQERHPELLSQGDDIQKFRTDMKLGREAVEWYIQKNTSFLQNRGLPITSGNIYLAHFLGPAGAAKLLSASPDTPVSQVAGADQINANRSILAGKTVGEVVAWANKKMGGAAVTSPVDEDPQFDTIPLEDKIAIQNGAQTKVDQEIAAATKAAQEAANAARNSLFVGLHDGTYDEADIQAGRNSGMLNDIDDIEKAEKILADRKEGISDQAFIAAAVAAGGAGYGTGDNERSNKAFEVSGGRQAIAARDNDYFNAGVLPQVQALQDIPTDLVGQLTTMARSNDSEAMRWAYDRFLDLQDKAPRAFDARVTDDMAGSLDQYRFMKGSATDEELNNYIRGGRNPQEISTSPRMDEAARKILTNPKSDAAKTAADITQVWDTWFGFEPTIPIPSVAIEMQEEFQDGFIYNFRVTGDETKAIELTKTQLQRRWDQTQIGGRGRTMMRLPPHKVGYPEFTTVIGEGKVDLDYDAIVREEFGITEDETFQLVSDRQTAEELERHRREGGPLPSYVIYKFTEDGRPIPQDGRWRYP